MLIYWINASQQEERAVQKLKEQIIWFSKVDLDNLWDLFSCLGLGSRGTWLKLILQVGFIYLLGILLIVGLIKRQMGQIEQFCSQPVLVRLIRVVDAVAYSQENARSQVQKRGVDIVGKQWVFPWLFHACLVREVLFVLFYFCIIFLRMLIQESKGKICLLFRILKITSPSLKIMFRILKITSLGRAVKKIH